MSIRGWTHPAKGKLLLIRRGQRNAACGVTMNMTEGKPLRLLTVFALPLLIGNLFQQAYNLADSMIVGRLLGANALAAVGATGSISFLFFLSSTGSAAAAVSLPPSFSAHGRTPWSVRPLSRRPISCWGPPC